MEHYRTKAKTISLIPLPMMTDTESLTRKYRLKARISVSIMFMTRKTDWFINRN
jgi:hypothetical protein